ncbi:MAG: hypothetical protein KAV87_65530, partial [Desulfobacteraceae bacterium]|nr:hypothetical protein [Desulfobacteraceae bacterium]
MTEPKKPTTRLCNDCGEEKPNRHFHGGNAVRCTACSTLLEQQKIKANTDARRKQKLADDAVKAAIRRDELQKKSQRKCAVKQRKEKERKEAAAIGHAVAGAKRFATAERKQLNIAKRELATRTLVKRHLLPFVVRHKPDYIPGWVHKDICAKLEQFAQDVRDKKSPRLMIQMPPRAGKSEIASVNFPAWYLGNNPNHEIILASYASSLAEEFSKKVRSIVRSDEYKVVFDKTRLDPDNQNASGWRTTRSGGFVPAGVGGGITGKGAHCVGLYSLVTTRNGDTPAFVLINNLVEGVALPEVLCYSRGIPTWGRIDAASIRKSDHHYKIEFSNGSKLVITGEHPLCTSFEGDSLRYTRVDELREGDRVVSVEGEYRGNTTCNETIRSVSGMQRDLLEEPVEVLRGQEGFQEPKTHLFKRMLKETEVDRKQRGSKMPRVRDRVQEIRLSGKVTRGSRTATVLFEQLLREAPVESLRAGETPPLQLSNAYVHSLLKGIQEESIAGQFNSDGSAFLFPGVLLRGHERESIPEGDGKSTKILPAGVQESTCKNAGGRKELCSMRSNSNYITSCGRGQREQRAGKFETNLRDVPHETPPTYASTTITSIERVEEETAVCDFEIEGAHNFVINNISASNCLIIDDPVKNAEEAESEVTQEKIWDW